MVCVALYPKELCVAFDFCAGLSGKLLIRNRNFLTGASEGAWQ
jgi:hypothetical protein